MKTASLQRGFAQIYLVYALTACIAVCGGLGWLLKSSYREQGKLQLSLSSALESVKSKDQFIADLQSERRKVEIITLDNMIEHQRVEVQTEKVVYKIQEIIRDAPPTDCLVTNIDSRVLDCLSDLSCDEARNPENLSSRILDGGLHAAGF